MMTTSHTHMLPGPDDQIEVRARRQDASSTITVNLSANFGNHTIALSFDDLNEAMLFAGKLTAALQGL